MSDKLFRLNITYAITDALICLVAILCFGYSAIFFSLWWVNLFSILPLLLFHQHSIVVDADVEKARKGEQTDESSR